MDTAPHNPLDYATPTKRKRKWFWAVFVVGCVLVALIAIWVIIAGGPP